MFCCISKGSVDFSVSVDKNAYVGGEKMQIIADINNRSKAKLRSKADYMFSLI